MNRRKTQLRRHKSAPGRVTDEATINVGAGDCKGTTTQPTNNTNSLVNNRRHLSVQNGANVSTTAGRPHHGMQTRSQCAGKRCSMPSGLGFTKDTRHLRSCSDTQKPIQTINECQHESPVACGTDVGTIAATSDKQQPTVARCHQNSSPPPVRREHLKVCTRDSGIVSDRSASWCESSLTHERNDRNPNSYRGTDDVTMINTITDATAPTSACLLPNKCHGAVNSDNKSPYTNTMDVDEKGKSNVDDDAELQEAIRLSLQGFNNSTDNVEHTSAVSVSTNAREIDTARGSTGIIRDDAVSYRSEHKQSAMCDPEHDRYVANMTSALKDEPISTSRFFESQSRDSGIVGDSAGADYTLTDEYADIRHIDNSSENAPATAVMNDNEYGHNSIDDPEVQAAIMLSLQCVGNDSSEHKDEPKENGTSGIATMQTDEIDVFTRTDDVFYTRETPFINNKTPDKMRRDSVILSSEDLDQDTIVTVDERQSVLTHLPNSIPRGYTDNKDAAPGTHQLSTCWGWVFHRKQKPDCASQIYIQYQYATDNPKLGDLFGATLATYRWKKDGHVYFQHFLTDVKDGSPASAMKIENWNELVLLNDAFVPNLRHEDVQGIFTRVKVDSHTRLTLIIRRISLSVNKHNKVYAWDETSAILIPEFPREPKAIELLYEPVTGAYDHRFWARMHGRDGALCLTVTQDDVTMQQLCSPDDDDPRDNARKICVWCKVLEDEETGLLNRYVLSLFGYHTLSDPKPFVAIDMLDVACVQKGRVFWYDFQTNGSQYHIKFKGQYLGYDGTNKVGLQKDEQYFVMRGTDKPNSSVQSHDSMDCSDWINTYGSSHIMSRDPSMDSDLSSKSSSAHMIQPDWSADLASQDDAVDGFSSADLPQVHAVSSSSMDDSMSSGYITRTRTITM